VAPRRRARGAPHDFWIEPSTFHPQPGAPLFASLRVGQQFVGDPVPRISSQIERFVVRDATGERDVAGFEGRDPAGFVKLEHGGAVIGYRSKPSSVSLPPEKFEQYLRDEGLERVIAERAKRGESKQPSREIYSRCAKALVGDRVPFERPLGFRYEITPVSLTPSQLVLRVEYESHPLAGAQVVAMHRDDPSLRLRARTDAHGRVTFQLPKRGVWLVKSVQIIDAPANSGAEWESLWASLTFEN
jgi:hypothetical protein